MNDRILWLSRQLAHSDKTTVTGYLGEVLLMEYMRGSDFYVYQPKRRKIGDLVAVNRATGGMLKIEVKTAKKSKCGRWQFCLNKNDKHGLTSVHHADMVILICVDAAGGFYSYVIPTNRIPNGQQRLTITSHPTIYDGKYSEFYKRWSVVPNCLSGLMLSIGETVSACPDATH